MTQKSLWFFFKLWGIKKKIYFFNLFVLFFFFFDGRRLVPSSNKIGVQLHVKIVGGWFNLFSRLSYSSLFALPLNFFGDGIRSFSAPFLALLVHSLNVLFKF